MARCTFLLAWLAGLPVDSLAAMSAFLVAGLSVAVARADVRGDVPAIGTSERSEWNGMESRMHAGSDVSVPAIIKYVPEGGSVLLQCDSPGWTYCR